ncbi:MAG: cytochrome-c oxidase, cbb3-type subunit III [Phenylobacterium sp.]|uniref:cytochrome-c oxidase, cbb3-type subunit III n=1 Tax=Phenylobacterium sp. TaxID=1871053 RepID=UPI001B58A1F6|nr:cytochrome-c oxidase, cbb3-type subunit III [Phenylobacterium sp.]MBP7817382.1 cytochrome-c oxidase, cbb3-type subunit III [Phenylobacterium sp.]MBP9231873.1 cytochrome-c oxidase, cbb3-type subunit III [Phenylobacterium sp.]MBP9755604.1 cytochrome-c oxidase, cbb3-type subunit III [Phenylobacterium sp.]
MSHRETDEHSGVETTGHEWDGIRELDNPLPRWWLYIFYGCIVIAAIYWVFMPSWPGVNSYAKGMLNQSDRVDVAKQLEALQTQRGAEGAMLRSASLETIEADPKLQAYALAVGQSVFGDNCATCHGVGGTGSKGYANLRDDVWLWGGSLQDIQHTIQVGVRSEDPQTRQSQMPAFGRDQILKPAQIDDLTEYVVALSRRPANAAAVARAAPVFAEQCVACHGPQGKGNVALGGPDLTDADWLYGGNQADIREQIWNGRGGVMPAWQGRFSPETIKALAVYVHANAGGQ